MTGSIWGEFLGLALIHFLAVVAPGPDFAVTVRQSVRYGRRAGILTALGIGLGISVHVVYTLVGVSALLHTTPWLMDVVRLLGGGYLIYLGVQFLRSRPAGADAHDAESSQEALRQGAVRAFWTGFLTNATNPKATLFFLAVFTTVVSTSTPLAIQALYGVWMCIVNALWFVLVSLMFTHPAVRARFLRNGWLFERAMGVLLIVFALRLLLVEWMG